MSVIVFVGTGQLQDAVTDMMLEDKVSIYANRL